MLNPSEDPVDNSTTTPNGLQRVDQSLPAAVTRPSQMHKTAPLHPATAPTALCKPLTPTKGQSNTANYDRTTLLTSSDKMKKAGYVDRKQREKSVKEVFTKAVERALQENHIKRTAKA